MRLPWYVALDRWVRRHPKTYRLCAVPPLVLVYLGILPQSAVAVISVILIMSVGMASAELTLEHYADKWREEH